MRVRLLRAFFTLTTLAIVWLVASPAFAETASRAPRPSMMSMLDGASSPERSTERERGPAPGPMNTGAPLCDPRGATTFAPPPQMQEVEESLESSLTIDDCMPTSREDARRASPGRAPAPSILESSCDAAVITAVALLGRRHAELLPVPVPSTTCSRPGVRSTVDRPPRA